MITLMVMVSVLPVHALPTTGTFEVTFDQLAPSGYPNAGSGTFTSVSGNVTSYDFEFTVPYEDFSNPPAGLTWDGTQLSGSVTADYIISASLIFSGNTYEIIIPSVDYIAYNLGTGQCAQDGSPDNEI